jgi:hypothetical protein
MRGFRGVAILLSSITPYLNKTLTEYFSKVCNRRKLERAISQRRSSHKNPHDVSAGIVTDGKHDLQASGGLKFHKILNCYKDYTVIHKFFFHCADAF